MARHKEFEPTEVLEKAMDLFWRQGYEATSMQDLVQHMGINRQSLYDTFGGKHELFLAALDCYYSGVVCERFKLLDQPGSGLEAIRQLFRGLTQLAATGAATRGCLVANSALELAPHDKQTAHRVAGALSAMEEAFYRALVRARADGELGEWHKPRAVARFLTSSLMGGVVMAKAGTKPRALQEMADVALSVLD